MLSPLTSGPELGSARGGWLRWRTLEDTATQPGNLSGAWIGLGNGNFRLPFRLDLIFIFNSHTAGAPLSLVYESTRYYYKA